jgi:Helicase HerA, central domain
MAIILGENASGARIALPVEPSEKCCIAGVSGSGKSYLVGRMAEQWLMAGARVVVLDPVGIFWGLRTSFEGDPSGGMPIRIFGGARMDEQLRQPADAARRVAMGEDWSAVFDFSCMPFASVHWYAAEFLNALGALGPRIVAPVHIVVEEAPVFVPQTGSLSRYQRDCKAAFAQCARVYRNFGIGMTIVTQRAAAVSKDVLTQCGTVFAMRLAAKLDRRALMDWSASNASDVDVDAALARVAIAEPGHGVLLSPTWGGAAVNGKSFRVLPRSTFHPDPRRLAENREVELRPLQEPRQAESPSPWASLSGRMGRVLGRFFDSAVN